MGELLNVSSEHEPEHFLDKIFGAFGGLTSRLKKQLRPIASKLLQGAGSALGT